MRILIAFRGILWKARGISFLNPLLQNAFSICKTKAEQRRRILQDENLTEGLSNPAFIQDNPRQIMEMQIKNASEIIPEITKVRFVLTKFCNNKNSINHGYILALLVLGGVVYINCLLLTNSSFFPQICRDKMLMLSSFPPEVAKYANDCVNLCWSMLIQSPPFHLSWIAPHGEMVDTSKYTFYRTSGRYVDYVVWPVLFDCEGGTVIFKGVIQGRN